MDHSDEIYHCQKKNRANVVQKLRANVENLRESVVVVVVAGVGGMAEPLNFFRHRSHYIPQRSTSGLLHVSALLVGAHRN